MSPQHISFIGMILAIYAALLSTLNSMIQVITHLRDRADVVMKVRRNMSALGQSKYGDMLLIIVTATNRGKRPVTIHGFAATMLDTRKQFYMPDVRPTLPTEITEGHEVAAYLNQKLPGLDYVESYYVWDSVGREFRINIAPWQRRLASRFKRRFSPVDHLKQA
jgi:hypothetical protein